MDPIERCPDIDQASGETPFGCDQCDKTYTKKQSLVRHIKSAHQKIKPYTCQECDSSFDRRYLLEEHVQSHMNPNRRDKFQCQECNRHYFTRSGLADIDAVHKKLNPYPCPASESDERCSKMFQTKDHADRHSRMVHLKVRTSCPLASCDETFINAEQARAHYRRTHEGDSAMWRCPHCGKLLYSSRYMLDHIDQIHKKIRHQCPQCDKSYANKQDLAKHLKSIHSKTAQ